MSNRIPAFLGFLVFISCQSLCAAVFAAEPSLHSACPQQSHISPCQSPAAGLKSLQAVPRLRLTPLATRPIRAQRPYKIASSVGYNGLAGVGSQLSIHANPFVAFELGLGLADQAKPKAGLRLRLNLSSHEFSPFVGVGATYVFAQAKHKMLINVHGKEAAAAHESQTMAHVIFGVSDTWHNGLTLEAGIGYATLLGGAHHGREIAHSGATKARPTGRNSGPLMEITVGYSF